MNRRLEKCHVIVIHHSGGFLGAKPPEADGKLLKITYTDIVFTARQHSLLC